MTTGTHRDRCFYINISAGCLSTPVPLLLLVLDMDLRLWLCVSTLCIGVRVCISVPWSCRVVRSLFSISGIDAHFRPVSVCVPIVSKPVCAHIAVSPSPPQPGPINSLPWGGWDWMTGLHLVTTTLFQASCQVGQTLQSQLKAGKTRAYTHYSKKSCGHVKTVLCLMVIC